MNTLGACCYVPLAPRPSGPITTPQRLTVVIRVAAAVVAVGLDICALLSTATSQSVSTMAHHHHGHSHYHGVESSHYPKENYGPGAKWIKHLTQNRLGTFNGGHFSNVNLSSVLYIHRVDNQEHVKLEVWSAPGLTKPSFEEAMKQKFKSARKGDNFGPSCEFFVLFGL